MIIGENHICDGWNSECLVPGMSARTVESRYTSKTNKILYINVASSIRRFLLVLTNLNPQGFKFLHTP